MFSFVSQLLRRSRTRDRVPRQAEWHALDDLPAAARVTRRNWGGNRYEFCNEEQTVLARLDRANLSLRDGRSYQFQRGDLTEIDTERVVVPGVQQHVLRFFAPTRGHIDLPDGPRVHVEISRHWGTIKWNVMTITDGKRALMFLRWLPTDRYRWGAPEREMHLGEAVVPAAVALPVDPVLLAVVAFQTFARWSDPG